MALAPQKLSAENLASLLDASAAINASLALDETLQAIASAAAAVLRAEASSVIMVDQVRGKQVFRAAVGDRAEQLIGREFGAAEGIAARALQSARPVIVNDVSRDKAHYKEFDADLNFQTRSMIAAPLVHQGHKFGVVEIINPLHAEKFSDPDADLAMVFANLAAVAIANADLYERCERENRGFKRARPVEETMLGDSPAMTQVQELIDRVAPSAATVLLLGETGTGKELAARCVHARSPRADRPFIPVNCAALPETLLESELFGHEAGAFTGATGRRQGRFELAEGGTIFLDEIGEIAPNLQVKLLRVLQEKEIIRVGGNQTIGCDVRVIAATNRDLAAERDAGRFRADLYYRLNVFPIEIPPLRQRRKDIPQLAESFIQRLSAELKLPAPGISAEAMELLERYDYPGNIRELQNILERACLLCGTLGEIAPEHLPRELRSAGEADATDELSALDAAQRKMILNALRESNWNQTAAAKALDVSRDNLRYRIKKYNIRKDKD